MRIRDAIAYLSISVIVGCVAADAELPQARKQPEAFCQELIRAVTRPDEDRWIRLFKTSATEPWSGEKEESLRRFWKTLTTTSALLSNGAVPKLKDAIDSATPNTQGFNETIELWGAMNGRDFYLGCIVGIDSDGKNVAAVALNTDLSHLRAGLAEYIRQLSPKPATTGT
ncbi:MAG: hypothetical protein HY246_22605 [Proteobacteria bacterium]|nr:hypothetical protein [Pseudomonadota bacterium]